jgi:hypothetical protein
MTTDRTQEPNKQDHPVQGPDQAPTLREHPRVSRINHPRLIVGTYFIPRPIAAWILPPQEVFEYNFFEWKVYPSPKTYFLSQFPVLYQSQRKLFERYVQQIRISWEFFEEVLLTVTHLTALASEDYYPQSYHLRRPFKLSPQEDESVIRRWVPFSELFAVLSVGVHQPGYASILYGISMKARIPYTYTGNIRLPKAQHLYPPKVLVLALSFLLETGVLEVETGHYKSVHSLLDCDFSYGDTYHNKVAQFRTLEYKLDQSFFRSKTFYFQLPNMYVQYAWYQLLSTVYGTRPSPLLDTSLVNIYEHEGIHWTWSPTYVDRTYSCPAVTL